MRQAWALANLLLFSQLTTDDDSHDAVYIPGVFTIYFFIPSFTTTFAGSKRFFFHHFSGLARSHPTVGFNGTFLGRVLRWFLRIRNLESVRALYLWRARYTEFWGLFFTLWSGASGG
jgi:hypothetical protein